MFADELDYVVDRDEHVLAVVVSPSGAVVAQRSVRANARGYAAAARFGEEHANGARVWAIEGTGSYGAGLARFLVARGETVVEVGRGPRDERRLRGKDDSLDAIRAARTALASETLALPRAGQRREALRLLLVARRSAVDVRREALVQLRSVIVTAPDELREQLRRLPVERLLVRCSRLRRPSSAAADELATRHVLRRQLPTALPILSNNSCRFSLFNVREGRNRVACESWSLGTPTPAGNGSPSEWDSCSCTKPPRSCPPLTTIVNACIRSAASRGFPALGSTANGEWLRPDFVELVAAVVVQLDLDEVCAGVLR